MLIMDGWPGQHARTGAAAAAAGRPGVAIEDDGQRVDGQRVAPAVRQHDAEPEPARDDVLAHGPSEEEEALHAEAPEDEDVQLPLLPPLQ